MIRERALIAIYLIYRVDLVVIHFALFRLLATLLFIKPTFLYLWCYSLHIDELFIKEYADAVPSADFYLRDNDVNIYDII